MVELHQSGLNEIFRSLADPTRRAMLRELSERPRTVGELAQPFDISLAAASKHIQVLERAGLIDREVNGRVHICRLNARPLHAGAEWLRHYERFWTRKLDILEGILKAEDAGRLAKGPAKPGPARKKSSTPRRRS